MKVNQQLEIPPYKRTAKQTMIEALVIASCVALFCIILGEVSLRILLGSACAIASAGMLAALPNQEGTGKVIALSLLFPAFAWLAYSVLQGL